MIWMKYLRLRIFINQDTQFIKIYKEEQVSEIQGDHRFFQCSECCHDGTWDAVKPVEEMVSAMREGTSIPTELIPRCPKCGAEAFPWVRGYGNFLQGRKYDEQYQKVSRYIQENTDRKILFLACPVATAISLIGGKWKLMILRNLKERPWRFNELQRSIEGISQKVLTDSLRQMMDDGLAYRHDYQELPPRVEYGLTELGMAMLPIVDALADFGRYYKSVVEQL